MLVAFDFDGTITDRDSLQDFVRRMRGWGVCLKAYLACAPRVARLDRGPARRQAIKARFLASALAGLDRRQLEDLAQAYVSRHLPRLLRPEMLERLREHCRRGDTVVLVSASPSLYLDIWARQEGLAQVLATELGFDAQGRYIGLKSANCWGEEKVRRLQGWLGTPAVQLDMAYGDSQGDAAMLACTRRPWLRGSQAALPSLPE
ncbi:HAD-IB family hydrolase [Alcaligenes sp. Marseille-Q7550]